MNPVTVQRLDWDELTPQQRRQIIDAAVPACFPSDSRVRLAARPWSEIHPDAQRGLSKVRWEEIISGGVQ